MTDITELQNHLEGYFNLDSKLVVIDKSNLLLLNHDGKEYKRFPLQGDFKFIFPLDLIRVILVTKEEVSIFNLMTGNIRKTSVTTSSPISNGITLLPPFVAFSHDDNSVTIWDLSDSKERKLTSFLEWNAQGLDSLHFREGLLYRYTPFGTSAYSLAGLGEEILKPPAGIQMRKREPKEELFPLKVEKDCLEPEHVLYFSKGGVGFKQNCSVLLKGRRFLTTNKWSMLWHQDDNLIAIFYLGMHVNTVIHVENSESDKKSSYTILCFGDTEHGMGSDMGCVLEVWVIPYHYKAENPDLTSNLIPTRTYEVKENYASMILLNKEEVLLLSWHRDKFIKFNFVTGASSPFLYPFEFPRIRCLMPSKKFEIMKVIALYNFKNYLHKDLILHMLKFIM